MPIPAIPCAATPAASGTGASPTAKAVRTATGTATTTGSKRAPGPQRGAGNDPVPDHPHRAGRLDGPRLFLAVRPVPTLQGRQDQPGQQQEAVRHVLPVRGHWHAPGSRLKDRSPGHPGPGQLPPQQQGEVAMCEESSSSGAGAVASVATEAVGFVGRYAVPIAGALGLDVVVAVLVQTSAIGAA